MPKEYSRITRIADLIQRELTVILQQEIADPRLRFITITSVKVSRDLAFADILLTQLDLALQGQQTTKEVTIKLLKKAASRLRYALAQRLKLRIVPALRFFYDDLEVKRQRLHNLIDHAIEKDKAKRSG
ncbi:MAG: 30S ribosome-binding factor RbfA [Pseudomonadota bacterium]